MILPFRRFPRLPYASSVACGLQPTRRLSSATPLRWSPSAALNCIPRRPHSLHTYPRTSVALYHAANIPYTLRSVHGSQRRSALSSNSKFAHYCRQPLGYARHFAALTGVSRRSPPLPGASGCALPYGISDDKVHGGSALCAVPLPRKYKNPKRNTKKALCAFIHELVTGMTKMITEMITNS